MEQPENDIKGLLNFLRSHYIAVLATVNLNKSAQAASLYYFVDDNLCFYFLTKGETVKFKNIKENSKVALVITDTENLQTVQVEGVASEVDYAGVYAPVMKKYLEVLTATGSEWQKLPINHLQNKGYYNFIQIKPTWIRWSDFKDWAHLIRFEQKSEIA